MKFPGLHQNGLAGWVADGLRITFDRVYEIRGVYQGEPHVGQKLSKVL